MHLIKCTYAYCSCDDVSVMKNELHLITGCTVSFADLQVFFFFASMISIFWFQSTFNVLFDVTVVISQISGN